MIYTIDNPKKVKDYFSPEDSYFTGVVKDRYGDIAYYVNGRYHREDGPAVIHPDGAIIYYQNGMQHREDGPAVLYPNCQKEYWINRNLHREDGPAVIFADGSKEYWLNNKKLNISTDQELKDYLMLRMFE